MAFKYLEGFTIGHLPLESFQKASGFKNIIQITYEEVWELFHSSRKRLRDDCSESWKLENRSWEEAVLNPRN